MPSELRIKCFLGEEARGESGNAVPRALCPDTKSWNTTGDRAQVRDSLAALLDQLDSSAGDFLVKVVVHRKLSELPSTSAASCSVRGQGTELPGHSARSSAAPSQELCLAR